MLQKTVLVIILASLFLICSSLAIDSWTTEMWKDSIWQLGAGSVTQPWEVIDWTFMFGIITFFFSLTLLFHSWKIQKKLIYFFCWSLLVPGLSLWVLLFHNGGGFISFGGYEELLLLWGVLIIATSVIVGLVYKIVLRIRS